MHTTVSVWLSASDPEVRLHPSEVTPGFDPEPAHHFRLGGVGFYVDLDHLASIAAQLSAYVCQQQARAIATTGEAGVVVGAGPRFMCGQCGGDHATNLHRPDSPSDAENPHCDHPYSAPVVVKAAERCHEAQVLQHEAECFGGVDLYYVSLTNEKPRSQWLCQEHGRNLTRVPA